MYCFSGDSGGDKSAIVAFFWRSVGAGPAGEPAADQEPGSDVR